MFWSLALHLEVDIVFFLFSNYLEIIEGTKQYPPLVVDTKGCRQLLERALNITECNWLWVDLFKINEWLYEATPLFYINPLICHSNVVNLDKTPQVEDFFSINF